MKNEELHKMSLTDPKEIPKYEKSEPNKILLQQYIDEWCSKMGNGHIHFIWDEYHKNEYIRWLENKINTLN